VPGPLLVDLGRYAGPERVIRLRGDPGKREVLRRLAELTAGHPSITDKTGFVRAIFEREEVTCTGIGSGVAVPHARMPSVREVLISVGLCPDGIDYGSADGKPVQVIVMIAASDQDRRNYLPVLATVAARLKDPSVRTAMLGAPNPRAVLDRFVPAVPAA
jgi:mannitol/fructose-specific phosphotransferase system IIA component (Ntr-type)